MISSRIETKSVAKRLTKMSSDTQIACSTIDAAFAMIDRPTVDKKRSTKDARDSIDASGHLSDSLEDTVETLDEARKLMRDLRSKCRAQAQQIIAWRRAYATQELLVKQVVHDKNTQHTKLLSQILLFESRLIRDKKQIEDMLNRRQCIIRHQQCVIDALTNRLIENGLEPPTTELEMTLMDFDSLNDSDSAVVMEEMDSDCMSSVKYRSGIPENVTIVRSISDAIETNLKYSSVRRNNCYLRRPDILETVYSVEEDGDGDSAIKSNDSGDSYNKSVEEKRDKFKMKRSDRTVKDSVEQNNDDNWSYSVNNLSKSNENTTNNDKEQAPKTQVTTYNRVMSNHRSVTKPKDVKYKRINKAKSKSLEELRGRLRNWVEKGNRLAGVSLEHSQSYA